MASSYRSRQDRSATQKSNFPRPMIDTTSSVVSGGTTTTTRQNATADLCWIHCNSCFEMYTRKAKRIFLLSCHHLGCETCTKEQPMSVRGRNCYKCPTCGQIVRGRELGNNIPQQLKQLFHPMPWLDCVFNVQIFDFQLKHRSNYVTGFITPLHKYLKRMNEKQEFWRKRTKQTYEELKDLKMKRNRYEIRVRNIIDERRKQEMAKRAAPRPAVVSQKSVHTLPSQRQYMSMARGAGRGRGYLVPPTRSVSNAGNSFISSFNTFPTLYPKNDFQL